MKALFLFLLLLNILYGLWQLQDNRASRAILEVADSPADLALPAPAAPAAAAPASERPASTPLCVHLGVFPEELRAEQLRQRLLALGIQSRVISRPIPGATSYWLVMDVVGGRPEALAQLAILQDRGIDSFLISEGPLANNISLGVFARDDNAKARRAQLQALGYRVEVEPVERSESEYLVEVDAVARRLVDQALLARLRADFPGLQHHYPACPGVPVAGLGDKNRLAPGRAIFFHPSNGFC